MGKEAPKADPMMGIAALKQAETGQQWLDFMKGAYGESMERQVGIDALTKQVTEQQIAAQNDASKWANEDRDRYTKTILPLQDEFIEKAKNWDSADRQAEAAAEAKADVQSGIAAQDQARQRQQSAMGINPTSGRWAANDRAADTMGALATAGAANNARSALRKQALALEGEAINMGNGLPSQAAQALGLGVSSGSSAVNSTIAAQQPRSVAIGQMGQGFQGAMQGYAGMGDTLYKQGNLNQNAYKMEQSGMSSLMGGIGQLAGFAFMRSDEDAKEDKKPAKGILDAVKNMRVESWRYKEGDPANDGGDEHVGTYAQDFQKETGLGDGKSINVIDAIGVTMGAVKELAQQVDKLAGEKAEGAPKREAKAEPRQTTARRPQPRSIMRMAA